MNVYYAFDLEVIQGQQLCCNDGLHPNYTISILGSRWLAVGRYMYMYTTCMSVYTSDMYMYLHRHVIM